MSDKELTEAEKQKLLKKFEDPREFDKFVAETQKLAKDIQDKIAEKELDREMEKQKKLLEKQNKLLDLQIQETKTELQIEEYKKKAILPKTNSEARLKIIHEIRGQILEIQREAEVRNTGEDPNPKFLGKSEDGKESVVEIYNVCWNCRKVYKTFKNTIFCSEKCRHEFVSKHQKQKPLIQEEWIERNKESWDWERIGSYSDETGQHGIFRRVFK